MSLPLPDGTVVILKAPDVAPSSVVEVWVERFDPALGEDFGWRREPDAVVVPEVKTVKRRPAGQSLSAKQRARAQKLLRQGTFDVLLKENLLGKLVITPTLWEGTVTLPEAPGGNIRYRLAIAEYEEYLVDDPRPYDPVPTAKDRRLVFIEYLELS
jgi:hypothetical protein